MMFTIPPIPDPLEAYAVQFGDLFSRASQRAGFRQSLARLLPAKRNKMLTALTNTEPVVGAQKPTAQRLQWFLSESTWDVTAVTARRLELLQADLATALHASGKLLIHETGDRKWVEQQYKQVKRSLGWSQSGALRSGHAPALGAGAVRLRLLLVHRVPRSGVCSATPTPG